MSRTLNCKGIILKSTNIFEKDKLVELFSPTLGKIKILAKNANTKSFKYGGAIEALVHCDMVLYPGKSFLLLNHSSCIQTFPHIRSDFNTISLALYYVDSIRKITDYDQENPELFDLLLQTLHSINDTNIPKQTLHSGKKDFQLSLLKTEGVLEPNITQISENQFKEHFQNYCSRSISEPRLL